MLQTLWRSAARAVGVGMLVALATALHFTSQPSAWRMVLAFALTVPFVFVLNVLRGATTRLEASYPRLYPPAFAAVLVIGALVIAAVCSANAMAAGSLASLLVFFALL